MALRYMVFLLVFATALSGCLSQNQPNCNPPSGDGCCLDKDGKGICDSRETTTTTEKQAKADCISYEDVDARSMCLIMKAQDMGNPYICDTLDEPHWKNVCYLKFNLTERVITTTTKTTTTRPTTQRPTTTLDPCGNGVLEPWEECDPGEVCREFDGICRITGDMLKMAVCAYQGTCDNKLQVPALGKYSLGACKGCWGPKDGKKCTCFTEQTTTTSTTVRTTIRAQTTTTTPAIYYDDFHFECSDGECKRMMGKGASTCSTAAQCRHTRCLEGRCITVDTPGKDECDSKHLCQHMECQGCDCVSVLTPGTNECTNSIYGEPGGCCP